MYSFLVAATGWTWDYIDEHMTFSRYQALCAYYEANPPVHLMMKQYFAALVKSGGGEIQTKEPPKDGAEILKDFPAGITL